MVRAGGSVDHGFFSLLKKFLNMKNIMRPQNTILLYYMYCATICPISHSHGHINYIDTKAKWRSLKKLTCKWTLRQVFIVYRLEIQ
jgi:hypothetical protein